MSKLLSPVEIAKLSLNNHVVMSPMCMYEVKEEDGIIAPFHYAHYGARALSKVGLIIIEATGVTPDGRITNNDLGLWNEEQAVELGKFVNYLQSFDVKVGIQLSHAGRKAKDAVRPLSSSSLPFSEEYRTPNEMTLDEIKEVQSAFVSAVKRAVEAGIDMIELHGAHGYLMNQFLSPAVNKREDSYGGTLENRYRFVKEIIEAVRGFYKGSLWIRLSMSDYLTDDEQNSIHDWQQIGQWLEQDGIDCIDVSTGGVVNAKPTIPIYPGYQVPFTSAMKEAVTIPVTALGLLDDAGLCEYLLQTNQADLILEGRALIRNVNWLADAAKVLHDKNFTVYNHSYQRGQIG
ncbi:MAG: NADH:flavin oxidoreductase/NADH oxidase [Enterococcus sp.]